MLTTIISTLLISLSANADTAIEIFGWDSALPNAQNQVVRQVQSYAIENFRYDHWQGSCGGDTADFELSNYYTHESFEGELIHKIKVKVLVTHSYRHCEDVVVSECEVPLTVYTANHVTMAKWQCTVVDVP